MLRPRHLPFVAIVGAAAVACGGDDSTGAAVDSGVGDVRVPEGGVDSAGSRDGGSAEGGPSDGAAESGDGGDSGGTLDSGEGGAPSCTGPFTLTNQQPVPCVPYPGSLWYKPLPADVMSHLAPGSDAIAVNTFTDNGQFTYPWTRGQSLGVVSTVTSDGDDPNSPLYYGGASDPVYQIASCPSSMAPGPHNAIGKTFHAPSSAPLNFEGSDSFFAVWDQTDDQLYTAYVSSSTWQKLPACPGGGHAGTQADPCPVTFGYCGVSSWSNDPGFGIGGSGDSLGNGGWATHNRGLEMMSGSLAHAQYLETDCTVGHVFPAPGDTFQCSAGTTNKPPEGSLFFLDYTPAQLADIMSKVPLWQYELLAALTVYGGYVGDTHGGPEGLPMTRFEGPAAYNLAGLAYPLGDWLLSFPHADPSAAQPLYCFSRTAGQECEFSPFVSVPFETGPSCPTTPCDVSMHLHVADPCVALGLAGMAGGCP